MRIFITLQKYASEDAEMAIFPFTRPQRAKLRHLLEKRTRKNLLEGKVIITSGKPEEVVILGPSAKAVAAVLQARLQED